MAEEIEIRAAVPEDAGGIARAFLESAEYHSGLDPDRYLIPTVDAISARYREGPQHAEDTGANGITLVAALSAEIAVRRAHWSQGIGGRLLQAAEDWGRELGAEFASLEYHVANTRASLFYQERLGYRPAAITAIKRLRS